MFCCVTTKTSLKRRRRRKIRLKAINNNVNDFQVSFSIDSHTVFCSRIFAYTISCWSARDWLYSLSSPHHHRHHQSHSIHAIIVVVLSTVTIWRIQSIPFKDLDFLSNVTFFSRHSYCLGFPYHSPKFSLAWWKWKRGIVSRIFGIFNLYTWLPIYLLYKHKNKSLFLVYKTKQKKFKNPKVDFYKIGKTISGL